MGPGFDDAAVFHDVDDICSHGGRETMGDDERRATEGEIPEAVQPIGLGPGVHRRGRFVEDDDRGLAWKGSLQRNPLPLVLGYLMLHQQCSYQQFVNLWYN